MKTYIVEDNAIIRDNLIGTLEELACVVCVGTAEDENQGISWLTDPHNEWDLAIVDLFLKQGSGMGVLSACQNRSSTQKMVVLSNYATTNIRQRCSYLSADAVFDKSTELEALMEFCLKYSHSFDA